MRIKISPRLMEIAYHVAKIPGFKILLKPLYYLYIDVIGRNRNSIFRSRALTVFKEFDEILMQNGIHYSAFAGTLLGAIREKGFIKHDCDIDVCIWYKDFSPKMKSLLESFGFKLVRRFEVDGGSKASEETYQKDGIDIDIFYIYSDDRCSSYQCDFWRVEGTGSLRESMRRLGYVKVRRIEFPVSYDVVRVPFETIEINVMLNASEWLLMRYGNDYMIPNPKFHDTNNPKMFEWVGVKAVFVSNEKYKI